MHVRTASIEIFVYTRLFFFSLGTIGPRRHRHRVTRPRYTAMCGARVVECFENTRFYTERTIFGSARHRRRYRKRLCVYTSDAPNKQNNVPLNLQLFHARPRTKLFQTISILLDVNLVSPSRLLVAL